MRVLMILPYDKSSDQIPLTAQPIASLPETPDLTFILNLDIDRHPSASPLEMQLMHRLPNQLGSDTLIKKINAKIMLITPAPESLTPQQMMINPTVSWLLNTVVYGPAVYYSATGQDLTEQDWLDLQTPRTTYTAWIQNAMERFSHTLIRQLMTQHPILATTIDELPHVEFRTGLDVVLMYCQDILETLRDLPETPDRHAYIQAFMCANPANPGQYVEDCRLSHVLIDKITARFSPILGQALMRTLSQQSKDYVWAHVIDQVSALHMFIKLDLQNHIVLVNFHGLQQWYQVNLLQDPWYIRRQRLCAHCHRPGATLKCSCNAVYYCNQQCMYSDAPSLANYPHSSNLLKFTESTESSESTEPTEPTEPVTVHSSEPLEPSGDHVNVHSTVSSSLDSGDT